MPTNCCTTAILGPVGPTHVVSTASFALITCLAPPLETHMTNDLWCKWCEEWDKYKIMGFLVAGILALCTTTP